MIVAEPRDVSIVLVGALRSQWRVGRARQGRLGERDDGVLRQHQQQQSSNATRFVQQQGPQRPGSRKFRRLVPV